MKTSEKNEIDLLLRALGRGASSHRANATPLQSNGEIGTHLDADELNCYAEGVTSTEERARYTRHLADCDSCRRIVAGLVPAAGVTRRYEAEEQKMGWSWREKLSALFAPSVLRFAVPALALTTIIAIAVVALRQQQHNEFIAQNPPRTAPAVSSSSEGQKLTTNDTPQSANSGPQSAASPGQQHQPPAESKERNLSPPQKSDTIQPAAVAPNTGANTDRAKEGFLQPGQSAGVAASQPTFAAEPTEAAAAPPPPPRAALSDASKAAEARQEGAEADIQKRRREDSKFQSRDENEVARPASPKGGPSRDNSQNIAGLSGVMSRAANNKDEKGSGTAVETRRVSGRLFQRRGNAWIDADYASGRATVNVSRGSEQFRALVADEPALRSIAEQLSGEVIVVWKGTVYRIR
jgi:hypothetical protein